MNLLPVPCKLSLWLLLILGLLGNAPCAAQYNAPENRVWIFGNEAGLDFNPGYPIGIASHINEGGTTGTLEANASVCDTNGLLQFYTDGSQVWDRLGNMMPGGHDITGLGEGSTNSTSQGALIIPVPDSPHRYYVFSLTAVDQVAAKKGKLFYSMVDMELNGGMGDVEALRKGILVDSGLTEKMIGIIGDRCNVWVLTCVRGQAAYKAYEISAAGFNPNPVVSTTGTSKNLSFGTLAVSPDRRHIATAEQALFGGNNGLELARFNAATGVVSDAVQLEPLLGYYGVCFSPDNTKLYGNNAQSIYQFDITAPDPAGTRTLICNNGRTTALQPGPDGRIYFQHSPSVYNKVSYIRYPNLPGTACQAILDTLTLFPNTTFSFGMHNTVPAFKRDTLYTYAVKTAGCFATSYRIGAADTSGWGYTWNTGSTDPRMTVTVPGDYWLSYHTAPCVFHTDSFRVSFPDGFLPQIGLRSNCKGEQTGKAWAYTYSSDTVQYHYTWRNAAGDTLSAGDTLQHAVSGNYSLAVHTLHCDTVLFFFLPEEAHMVSFSADTLICLGSTVSFQNTSDNYYTSFTWTLGDQQTSTLTDPVHTYTIPGSYTVMLAGAGPVCRDTAYHHVVVDAPVPDMSFVKDKDNICMGQSVLFTPQTDSTLLQLRWQLDADNSFSAAPAPVSHAYDKAGIVPVSMTAVFRVCPAVTFQDTVDVYALPHVDLGPDSVLCFGGQPIVLLNHAAVLPGTQYSWSTGETGPDIRVLHEGAYGLTLTEAHGCAASEWVTVRKDCYIDIPNAFTPNGDGYNDYFFPRLPAGQDKLTAFHLQVLNRWGQMVFETSHTEGRGWDGRFNSKEQPEGVYLYRIQAVINGHTENYQGNITLLR